MTNLPESGWREHAPGLATGQLHFYGKTKVRKIINRRRRGVHHTGHRCLFLINLVCEKHGCDRFGPIIHFRRGIYEYHEIGTASAKGGPRYVSNPCTPNQADSRPNRSDRERHGAYRAWSVSLVDLCTTMSLRPTYGRNWDVVRYCLGTVALFRNRHLLCRAFQTLSRRGIIVLLRRTSFLVEVEGIQICPNRQVHGWVGQPSLLLDLSRRDGCGHRYPIRLPGGTAVSIGIQLRDPQSVTDDLILHCVPAIRCLDCAFRGQCIDRSESGNQCDSDLGTDRIYGDRDRLPGKSCRR